MLRMTKAQTIRRDELQDKLAKAAEKVDDAVAEYNAAADEARTFLEEMREAANEYYEARSDAWKESDKGDNYLAWCAQFEEEVDDIDLPDMDSQNHIANLEEAPTS